LSLAEQQAIWSALGETRYAFRHTMLRDTAYEMQLLARRRELHTSAIAALEQVYAADLASHYGELAYHAEHGQNSDLQRRYYGLAGDAARSAFATVAALGHYRRLMPLVNDPLDQAELCLKISDVLGLDGQYQLAIAQLKPWSERLAGESGTRSQSIYIAVQVLLGKLYAEIGDLNGTRHELEAALRVARSAENRRGQAQVLSQLGRVALWQGAFQEAEYYLQEALPLARALNDVSVIVFTLRQLGNVGNCLGQYAKAHAFLQESLQLAQQLGEPEAIGAAYSSLGSNITGQGDYAQALVCLQEAVRIARWMGSRYLIANFLTDICNTHYLQGDYIALQRVASEALELGRSIGSRQQTAWALAHLGSAAVALRQLEPARHYLQESLHLCQQIGDMPRLMFNLITYAVLLTHSNQPGPAAELLGMVLAQPTTQDETRRKAHKALDQLRAAGALSPHQLELALQRGQTLSLDQVLQIVLGTS
jgi:tetratricopeptide (TPR) repeat protein